ncbi:AAA family ATPase [Pantoea endophytica]|uniref:AAA family ATPase n=1 Tax=Pantoea endophytica TaxID=92488 RepID=UPI0028A044F7|nr:AAA family ATPase [Pantoea endophytica]
MIESLKLANVATYDADGIVINNLKEINFFYGANGSGKTTASNYLSNTTLEKYNNCSVTWRNNQPLTTLVYNKEFRDKNFSSSDIAGVFTLGEATTEQIADIKSKKSEQDDLEKQLNSYTKDHLSKITEQNTLNAEFTEKCWSLYKKYEIDLKEAFKGFQKKDLFKSKIISTHDNSENLSDTCDYETLKERSLTILGEKPEPYRLLNNIESEKLDTIESDLIWKEIITGKHDVDIAGLIESLGCQDWVNHGRKYINSSKTCPFCQKDTIDDDFKFKIEQFFDKSYEFKINATKDLAYNYHEESSQTLRILKGTLLKEKENINSMLNIDELGLAITSLESQFSKNLMAISNKLEKPSEKVEMTSTREALVFINNLIMEANSKIISHNKIVTNYGVERELFIKDTWIFLAEELKNEISLFSKKLKGASKAAEALSDKINECKLKIESTAKEIAILSRNTTSVQPAVNEMNRTLKAYGFINFEILPSERLENHYVIKRQNGDLAFESLSEGEVTFITFLYFVQLANGAAKQDDITQNRVVVIDDPISSLDSNVLYIVSAIVKGMISSVKLGSSIKQLLLLTHNIYFHKEASFQNGRSNGCNKTHFWIIRKSNNRTSINFHEQKNPINSAYELMWKELKDKRHRSGISTQNIMRRILENYFKILGKLSDDDIVAKFEKNEEQQICLSLLHWINDGSHCIPDDLFIQTIDDQIEVYLRVFKNIFIKSGHESHYEMMMAGDELFEGENKNLDDAE